MSRADKIFISYRRDDSAFAAGRIYDRLTDHFGDENVFFDVDSIPIGVDFVEYLSNEVRQCSAFVSIIGDRWLDAQDALGNRRLDNEEDFVRIEIEAALDLGLLIVPVLINGAEMPHAAALPVSVRPITRRNALSVSHARFKADADGMVRQLDEALKRRDEEIAEREREAERLKAEDEARKSEEARAAAEAQAKEQEAEAVRQLATARETEEARLATEAIEKKRIRAAEDERLAEEASLAEVANIKQQIKEAERKLAVQRQGEEMTEMKINTQSEPTPKGRSSDAVRTHEDLRHHETPQPTVAITDIRSSVQAEIKTGLSRSTATSLSEVLKQFVLAIATLAIGALSLLAFGKAAVFLFG